ncbi:MAG: helix-turn-helix transcriptional regulator [Oscillospiraceae bacterium]|jgi:transcriptional regulator with XRE-family HTH domain|nr:helix-turn-helix transcriptional regulator [Oscillospiraceae bacterium]
MANQYFSTRVKELREKAGLSMDQMAKQLGVTKSRINMWENNGTVPRMNVLVELAKFFSVTTDYLLGNDEAKNLSLENARLSSLQRNLGKLSEADLEKAEGMLKAVFMDIFNDDEDNDDDI